MHLCPRCGGESRVLDSRPTDDNIRRRRICRACEHRWTTIEISLDAHILMLERETAIAKLLAKL